MKKTFCITGIAVCVVVSAFAQAPSKNDGTPFSIAENGNPKCVIVQGAAPTKAEQLAVAELTDYLAKVTGARFEIMSETNDIRPSGAIYIGWTDFAKTQGIDGSTLGEEEWIIKSFGNNLVLTGGRQRGTLHAVYEFLENQVGCHWLSRDGTEIVPSKSTLTIPKLDVRGKPTFFLREILDKEWVPNQPWAELSKDMVSNRNVFQMRNKGGIGDIGAGAEETDLSSPVISPLGGNFPRGAIVFHTFPLYVPASKWFKSHPEYFSLNSEGKRVPAQGQLGPGQLCLTNPDVRRLTLESLREFIAQDRAEAAQKNRRPPWIYDISQCDISYFCTCTNCQEIVAREGGDSGPLVDFINAIAEDIEKDYPGIFIQTFAYTMTDIPPRTLKPRHNVIIRWCNLFSARDLARPLSHPLNEKNYKKLTGWGKIASHLAIWDYWVRIDESYSQMYLFPTPYCMVQCIKPDLELFANNHVGAILTQSDSAYEPGENFVALKIWLGYKLMVNAHQPVEPLIQTFMEGYYGAAAPKMNEYLKYLQKRIDKEAEFMMVRNAPHNLKYLDLNFFVTAEALFDEAEKAIKPGSMEALHVQKDRVVVDGALLWLWPWLDRKLEAEKKMPFDHETVIRRYETNWRAQSKAIHSEKAQVLRDARLARQVAAFRDNQLPEQFRNLPSREVANFNWLTFSPSRGLRCYPAPYEKVGETAFTFLGGKEEEYKKPLTFGVTGGATIILKPEEVPQDGKYHLFKIGRINVKKGTVVWALDGKKLGVNVDRLFVSYSKDVSVNDWDAYISLKVKGPTYVKGSTDPNGVWMDRVWMVKPQKGEKEDAAELLRQEDEKKMAARRAVPPPQVRVRQSPQGASGDPLKVDWSKAVSGGEWCTLLGYLTSRKAEVRFTQDGEYLYIRLVEELNPQRLESDPEIWNGDDWELFFAPKRGAKPYRQMAINPKGGHVELAYGEGSEKWDSGVNVISEIGANSWNVSLGVPLNRLLPGGVKPGQSVYVNILRSGKAFGDTLAWSPNFENNYHSLERLGEIILE